MDFWWSIPQKGTGIGHFGGRDDPTIRRLSRSLRPLRLLMLSRSLRLQRFLRPGKSLLRTSESSRLFNSALHWCIEKEKFLVESWNIILNLWTFSIGGCWGQPMLLFWKMVANVKMQALIEHIINPESYYFTHFNVVHPVVLQVVKGK